MSWTAEVRAHEGLTARWEVLMMPTADDAPVEMQHRFVENWEDLETLLATAGLTLDDVLWGADGASYAAMVGDLGPPRTPVRQPRSGRLEVTWPRTQVDR